MQWGNYYGLVKVGNHKVGDRCAVFNMGAAHDCPAWWLGQCQVCDFVQRWDTPWPCYAYMDEVRRPAVLAYRRRQEAAWRQGPDAFIHTLGAIQAERPDVTECRYNEAGDLLDHDAVQRLFDVAAALPRMLFYGYSARYDLRWGGRPSNLIVNGSGWSRGKMNNYVIVRTPSGKNPVCPGNCRTCGLCKSEKGLTIESILRRPGGRRKAVSSV